MSLVASDNITFEEAIAFTEQLISEMPSMSEDEKEIAIKSLVKTNNGARGLFVTYLTSDKAIADQYTTGIINALKTSPEIVGELLVKNVAMSTAMKIYHVRNNDGNMAEKSARVTTRSMQLIKQLDLDVIKQKLEQLKTTITEKQGQYQSFLQRWGYDEEQQQAILAVIQL